MNREVHVRIWERLEVRVLRATRQSFALRPTKLNDRCGLGKPTSAGANGDGRYASIPAIPEKPRV